MVEKAVFYFNDVWVKVGDWLSFTGENVAYWLSIKIVEILEHLRYKTNSSTAKWNLEQTSYAHINDE